MGFYGGCCKICSTKYSICPFHWSFCSDLSLQSLLWSTFYPIVSDHILQLTSEGRGLYSDPLWGRMPFWLQCTSWMGKNVAAVSLKGITMCASSSNKRTSAQLHSKSVVTQVFHLTFITTLWNRYHYHTKDEGIDKEYKALSAHSVMFDCL